MTSKSNGHDGTLSKLNVAIDALNIAKEVASLTPAKAVFGSVSVLLTMIRYIVSFSAAMDFWLTFIQDSMANRQDYVELGLNCAAVCQALDRGLNRRQLDELSESVQEAIKQLIM
jgi:hypothetical protein